MYHVVGFNNNFYFNDSGAHTVSAGSSDTIQIQLSYSGTFTDESVTGTIDIVPTSPYDMSSYPIQTPLTITQPPFDFQVSLEQDNIEYIPGQEVIANLLVTNNNSYDVSYNVSGSGGSYLTYSNSYISNANISGEQVQMSLLSAWNEQWGFLPPDCTENLTITIEPNVNGQTKAPIELPLTVTSPPFDLEIDTNVYVTANATYYNDDGTAAYLFPVTYLNYNNRNKYEIQYNMTLQSEKWGTIDFGGTFQSESNINDYLGDITTEIATAYPGTSETCTITVHTTWPYEKEFVIPVTIWFQ